MASMATTTRPSMRAASTVDRRVDGDAAVATRRARWGAIRPRAGGARARARRGWMTTCASSRRSRASARAATETRRPRERDGGEASSSARSALDKSGGLLYVRNFFDAATSARVREECEKMRGSVTLEHRACARQRLGMMVPSDNFVHEACVAKEVAERLSGLLLGEGHGANLVAGDVPVEYRVYPVGGSMDWHKDVALYTQPQYEIVYTVTNTSDSTTEWEDERTGMRYGGWTEPNSVIVVRAEGAPHRVTGVTRGERSIIKFVLTQTLEKTDDFFDNLLTYTH